MQNYIYAKYCCIGVWGIDHMKKELVFCVILLVTLAGCGQTNTILQKPQTTNEQGIAGKACTFEGTVFHYGDYEYDISKRVENVNAIMSCTPVGEYIVIEGHVSPKSSVYSIFNTKTNDFEKDIVGTNLIWRNEDINTIIYSYWSDIRAYDGSVIATLHLSKNEFVKQLKFSGDGLKVQVTVETETGDYTKLIELPR